MRRDGWESCGKVVYLKSGIFLRLSCRTVLLPYCRAIFETLYVMQGLAAGFYPALKLTEADFFQYFPDFGSRFHFERLYNIVTVDEAYGLQFDVFRDIDLEEQVQHLEEAKGLFNAVPRQSALWDGERRRFYPVFDGA